ncbi:outer membrane protein assembly factor BamB family protein [Leifsonia sp. 21MFCrub1.1]|uniref:outer membrane protein assembly factor BamB family protein n=1 Tax=Leifsonia sp. 21MFCrub1.1 TaxID=1798223 RepID=UPI0008929014|nr:PQQ-binding-like beta-propeller repeat protein [Leifsonia sp. 21MFCrub1.1]SEB02838.1 PQQ-like domain-containing protein [Leifsonia sp. 21MFCrub1.1]
MTATGPVFDPARSAILREILHETVATAPARPSRARFALVGGLVAAGVVLAGGTAALALSGALHFGPSEPAPAPTPSITSTPTPTPTPTATSTPSGRPLAVQTTPIQRHDVNRLGATPWSLDLPGTGRSCEQHHVYDIADGLALVQVGAHVVGDDALDCNDDLQHVSLSLVDTRQGTAIWTREWSWHAAPLYDVDVLVLGTSGRILVFEEALGGGPHDVIDLATGRTLADFAGEKTDILLNAQAVPGDSGDIVMSTPTSIIRVDPRDAQSPRWSTDVPGKSAWVHPMVGDTDFLPVDILLDAPGADGRPYESALIDLQTGRLDPGPNVGALIQTDSHPAAISQYDSTGQPTELTGLDRSGQPTWTRQLPPGSDIQAVSTSTGVAGAVAGYPGASDLIAVVSTSELTILDSASGTERWSASAARCGLTNRVAGFSPFVDVFLDPEHDTLTVVHDGTGTCTFTASTGAPRPLPDLPNGSALFFGPDNAYVFTNEPSGDLAAFDRQTGTKLWSSTAANPGSWSFAGGYLVRLKGDQLSAVG